MDELNAFKELGLNKHLEIAGYVFLASFIIKMLYEAHVQQFITDIKTLISKLTGRVSEAFKPSLYELLPVHAKKMLDFTDAAWSYTTAIFSISYFILFLFISKYLNWSEFTSTQYVLYFGFLVLFLVLFMAASAHGTKAVKRYIELKANRVRADY